MFGIMILAAVIVFAAVIAIRTASFTPKPQPEITNEEFSFDKEAATEALVQLVKCKTVSYNDKSLEEKMA